MYSEIINFSLAAQQESQQRLKSTSTLSPTSPQQPVKITSPTSPTGTKPPAKRDLTSQLINSNITMMNHKQPSGIDNTAQWAKPPQANGSSMSQLQQSPHPVQVNGSTAKPQWSPQVQPNLMTSKPNNQWSTPNQTQMSTPNQAQMSNSGWSATTMQNSNWSMSPQWTPMQNSPLPNQMNLLPQQQAQPVKQLSKSDINDFLL